MNQQPDKIFRDRLQGYEKPASPEAWKRIAGNIHKKNEKALWLKIAAAILMIAVAGVFLYSLPETTPEIQQHAAVKPVEPPRQKPDRRVAKPAGAGTETSSTPSPPARTTEKHEPAAIPIEKIIETNLNEARACLNNKNFECAIAKGETVLQFEPNNTAARALLNEAVAAQQKAWEASELK